MTKITNAIDMVPQALAGTVEVTKSVIEIDDKLHITKGVLNTVGNAADAFAPFIPLVGAATVLISEIISIYQQAEYNKKIISALYDRTKLAEYAIDTLQRRKKLNEGRFKSQEWYNAFNRFIDVLKEFRNFAKDVSTLRGYQKYLKSYTIKDKFEDLAKNYDTAMKDLNFTMAVANEEQRLYDNECLMEDVAEMKQFLQNIEGGIITSNQMVNAVIEELRLMRKSLESGKGPSSKPKQIERNEITDPTIREDTDCRGSKKHIVRRYYKSIIEVASKPFELNDKDPSKLEEKERIEYDNKQKQLAILSKLSDCTNILKFYGLASIDGKNHLILEWAHYGTLREAYEAYDIPWTRKLHIATDICRAISFLHSVEIYHHDLRCANIMLTKNLEPKLSNFDYSRGEKASTKVIGEYIEVVHWLAPEKISKKDSRYNTKCEIFSFGMLLWELAFEKIPYAGWELERIERYVKSGGREKVTFGLAANERESEIQKALENIIREAWKHIPYERISIVSLFNILEPLQSKYKSMMGTEAGLLPQKTLDLDGSGSQQPKVSDADMMEAMELPECEDFTIDFEIDTMISFEEGVTAHRNQDFKKAWECFKYHAENGNDYAKYWMGYYLWEGKYVEKNQEEAVALFKETADKGIHDGQLRYAFSLRTKLNKKKVREEFIKYLSLAADGGNSSAQFNLGDAYYNGKLKIPKDEAKGIYYLKLSALQSYPNATKMLENLKIDFVEEPKH